MRTRAILKTRGPCPCLPRCELCGVLLVAMVFICSQVWRLCIAGGANRWFCRAEAFAARSRFPGCGARVFVPGVALRAVLMVCGGSACVCNWVPPVVRSSRGVGFARCMNTGLMPAAELTKYWRGEMCEEYASLDFPVVHCRSHAEQNILSATHLLLEHPQTPWNCYPTKAIGPLVEAVVVLAPGCGRKRLSKKQAR